MAWLHAVYFLDRDRGWVAGSGGTLLGTKDGGQTWKRLHPLTKDTLHDVYFANENVGWLVAERDVFELKTSDEPRAYLLKTEDGGFSWRRVFLNGFDVNARLVRAVVGAIEGRRQRLDLPLDVRASAFRLKVWDAVRAIPYGEVRTYGELARAVGRPAAVRPVARACAANPVALAIPCHRVVPAAGGPGGYRFGVTRKRRLLAMERERSKPAR